MPLIALTLLAAALRFATLDLQSFDFDEAYTVGPVLGGSFGHMLDAVARSESSPPLYYVLAWLWSQPFGLGEVGIRSLSALAGTALVPVAYGAARELAGRSASSHAGLIAAAVVAVNPQLVFYSQYARAYSLFALLAGLSFWAFLVARRDRGARSVVLWALASAAALLTHYFAAFLVVPEALWLLAVRRPRLPVALGVLAVGAVGAALVPLAADQSDGRTDWIGAIPRVERIEGVVKMSLTGEFDPTSNWQLALLGLALAAALAFALPRASAEERRGAAVAFGLAAALVLVPLAIDVLAREMLVAKNAIAVIPLCAVGLACILGTRRAGRAGIAAAALLCVASIAIAVAAMAEPGLRRADYRAVAETLGRPPPGVAVLTPYHGSAPLARYSGAMPAPEEGVAVSELELVQPLGRADADVPARPATPPPPTGFELVGREDHPTFTRIRYRARQPVTVSARQLAPMAPPDPTFPPVLLVWPPA